MEKEDIIICDVIKVTAALNEPVVASGIRPVDETDFVKNHTNAKIEINDDNRSK